MSALNFSNFALQFITHGPDAAECVRQARSVLDGGCRWVQLRMKDADDTEVEAAAREIKTLADSVGATLIIDDRVDVCRRVGASGVHLGRGDMSPEEARAALGDGFVIGGTCNTIDDIGRVAPWVDYVGCGPFRFTETKKNLAPTLGLDGYRSLSWESRARGLNIPMVAIGGITAADIADILEAGPDGIALSGEIVRAADMTAKTAEIVAIVNSRGGRR